MSKAVKGLMIDSIKSRVGEHRDLIVLDVSRLPALTNNRLRNELSTKGIQLLTVKNAVARNAIRDLGINVGPSSMVGSTTLAFGAQDIVQLAKEMTAVAAKNAEVKICGGLTTTDALSTEDVVALSKSPGRKELLGMLVSLILSPGAGLSAAITGVGSKIASQIDKKATEE